MLIDKGELLKVLRMISGFDSNACAFLGAQLPQDDKPQFHRSGTFGFIQTTNFDLTKPHVFVSLANLKDLLNVSADTMDMAVDFFGKLRLESTEGVRLQIHTVRKEVSGYKEHYLGDPTNFRYPGDTFGGFDIRPFKTLTMPPIMKNGRLLIGTTAGVVLWTAESLNSIVMQPREAFLRFIAGNGCAELLVSKQGYWMAEKEGMLCAMAGHNTPTDMMDVYSHAGTELTRFHAPRLMTSLSNVAYLTSDTDRVELNPKEGIISRDKYSNPQVFPHGAETTTWPKATVFGRTAKVIVDALSQTNEETAVLYSVPLRNSTYRIVRGAFEVNFGLV
jgi:hypothetical protein